MSFLSFLVVMHQHVAVLFLLKCPGGNADGRAGRLPATDLNKIAGALSYQEELHIRSAHTRAL